MVRALSSHICGLVLLLGLSATAKANAEHDNAVVARCTAAATALLDGLADDQKAKATAEFHRDARKTWVYFPLIPGMGERSEGLLIEDMTEAQRADAHKLIGCGLSSQGYLKATGIMTLDDITNELRGGGRPGGVPTGSGYFWVAIFGDPSTDDPWGWQVEGHHLGLNFTVTDGDVSVTPSFFGAQPAEVAAGPYAGYRVLGNEVDKALVLLASLDENQQAQAVLGETIPNDIFTEPGEGDAISSFEGLKGSELNGEQQNLLLRLIEEYVGDLDRDIAAHELDRIATDGLDQVYFAWMGGTDDPDVFYYRVHGPSFLIEFDHTINRRTDPPSADPTHIHTILRHPGRDFGDDLLREHYANSSDHQAE